LQILPKGTLRRTEVVAPLPGLFAGQGGKDVVSASIAKQLQVGFCKISDSWVTVHLERDSTVKCGVAPARLKSRISTPSEIPQNTVSASENLHPKPYTLHHVPTERFPTSYLPPSIQTEPLSAPALPWGMCVGPSTSVRMIVCTPSASLRAPCAMFECCLTACKVAKG
jgi:hypothetical protein